MLRPMLFGRVEGLNLPLIEAGEVQYRRLPFPGVTLLEDGVHYRVQGRAAERKRVITLVVNGKQLMPWRRKAKGWRRHLRRLKRGK